MSDLTPSPANLVRPQAQPDPAPGPAPTQQQTSTHPPAQNPNPLPAAPFPAFPGAPPSFRPIPQFSPLPNYQAPPPGVASGMQYQVPGQASNPALRPSFAPLPNGYAPPHGTVAPSGIARFPSPYPPMVRPLYPMRPPGVLPAVSRPPMPGIIGLRPVMPPIVRPTFPSVTPAEKPQTTVYVGKIAPSVEDDFILSLLRLCGPVKGWKRGHNPSGTPVGFGFCEFESAEGILRALRLLSKLSIDGQALLLNVNEATRKYLERYVEKKTENSRNLKESQTAGVEKDGKIVLTGDENQSDNSSAEDLKNESDKKDNHDLANFGIATDEDREEDRDAVEKITEAIEERLKTRPLPPPPPPPPVPDVSGIQSWELQTKPKDGDAPEDGDAAEDKNDNDTTSENKETSEQDRPASSPDRSRRYDRRSRDRDRDLKREQEREVERYEREAERERVRKEREQRRKIEDAERAFEEWLKDWEYREREKEKQRQYEKEREKEKDRKRRKEIQYDEDDEDDDRKRWRRSVLEDKRKKRLQEKKEDLADRQKEEEEIMEAQRRTEEEKQRLLTDGPMHSTANIVNEGEETVVPEEGSVQNKDKVVEEAYQLDSGDESQKGDAIVQNGLGDEMTIQSVLGAAPTKKLGFGLVGSGKRAAVPSVFSEEDDDAHKDKKMRPLVPIDYTTEELHAIQPTASGATQSNLAAAVEYAKRISNVTPKEEKPNAERERSRRNHDRSSQWERDHEDGGRLRDGYREKALDRDRDRVNDVDRVKTPDKQKLLDAKQLIDMIPKSKEELFSYEINWSVYDKHELHKRLRPWLSKKITEFLGEEEATLVDYIVTSTQDHVQASQMLEMLQAILDDEAEMFVLKMWRMLIFEIKKVETGLSKT